MHISLALGLEAAMGEISSWICSCVKLCRVFQFTQLDCFKTLFQWSSIECVLDASAAVLITEFCWQKARKSVKTARMWKQWSDFLHFRVRYYYLLLYGKSVYIVLSFLVVLCWEYFIPNAQCLLLGPHNCVGLNAAALSGQKCYVVFISEAGALLYVTI